MTTTTEGFCVTVSAPHAFRSLVHALAEVLPEAPFRVVAGAEGEFSGLQLNQLDASTICCVWAQFSAPVTGVDGLFCVNTKNLLTFLRKIDAASVLEIRGSDDSDQINIVARDAHTTRRYTLPKIWRDASSEMNLCDMDVTHTMSLRTSSLAQFLSICNSQKYPSVQFIIRAAPGGGTYVTMRGEGDAGAAEETYLDAGTVPDKDHATLDLARGPGDHANPASHDPPEDAEVVFTEHFNQPFMHRFVRGLDADTLRVQFCGPARPMIITCGLGVDLESSVRFVLANQVTEY